MCVLSHRKQQQIESSIRAACLHVRIICLGSALAVGSNSHVFASDLPSVQVHQARVKDISFLKPRKKLDLVVGSHLIKLLSGIC